MSEIDARSAIDAFTQASKKLTESLHRKVEIEKMKEDIDGRDVAIMRLNHEIDKLSEELAQQKAIASAELDSMHKLGDDYAKVLEEEQQHIREAKVEAVKEIGKILMDKCHDGIICAVDVLDIVVDYMKECETDER